MPFRFHLMHPIGLARRICTNACTSVRMCVYTKEKAGGKTCMFKRKNIGIYKYTVQFHLTNGKSLNIDNQPRACDVTRTVTKSIPVRSVTYQSHTYTLTPSLSRSFSTNVPFAEWHRSKKRKQQQKRNKNTAINLL